MTGRAATPRLLVIDLPYERVWEGAVRAFDGYAAGPRAPTGIIETARAERAPLPDEKGVERVAERITVRSRPSPSKVTRVTVKVRDGGPPRRPLAHPRWRSATTVRRVLERIRAGTG